MQVALVLVGIGVDMVLRNCVSIAGFDREKMDNYLLIAFADNGKERKGNSVQVEDGETTKT